jgi:hypothetical protein
VFKQWIETRRSDKAPEASHVSVNQNWPERLTLFNEPRVQEFVEWLLDDDEDDSEEDDESDEDDDA